MLRQYTQIYTKASPSDTRARVYIAADELWRVRVGVGVINVDTFPSDTTATPDCKLCDDVDVTSLKNREKGKKLIRNIMHKQAVEINFTKNFPENYKENHFERGNFVEILVRGNQNREKFSEPNCTYACKLDCLKNF